MIKNKKSKNNSTEKNKQRDRYHKYKSKNKINFINYITELTNKCPFMNKLVAIEKELTVFELNKFNIFIMHRISNLF